MKKIIIMLLIALTLCACSSKKEEEPPVDNTPVPTDNQPVPADNTPDEKEYTYQLEKKWVAYDFELLHLKQSYEIKDGLTLKLSGKEGQADYCQNNPCIIYDEVMINDKDIALLENMNIKINSDYGTLTMYNLNDELFILNFNFAALYNSCCGIVFSDEGELIMTYEDCDLTMNEVNQNQFGLTHTGSNGNSTFDIYTAEGKTLAKSSM